jgi:ribosomal protein L21E
MFRTLPVFGADLRGISEVVRGIMDGKTNNTGTITLATGNATTTTIQDYRIGADSVIILVPDSEAAYEDSAPYGAFQDSTDQVAANTTTSYAMTFNTTDYSNGVSVVSNSRMTVKNYGIYNLQFSAQLVNTDTSIHDIDIWFRKNGTNIPASNSRYSVPNSHGGVDGSLVAALNYYIELNANDYVEIMWATDNTAVSIQQLATRTSPDTPSTPSVIATMQYVAPAASTNVYVTAKGKGTATLTHYANNTADKTYAYIVVG